MHGTPRLGPEMFIRKPIKDKRLFLKSNFVIFWREIYYLWTKEQKNEAEEEIRTGKNGVYKQILCDQLSLQQTIDKYKSHKKFILKTYKRFRKGFPNLSLSTVEEHDLSKMSLLELVGYTAR